MPAISNPCPTCEGKAEIAGADGRKVYCTFCYGTGYVNIGYTKVYWTQELQIGQVTVSIGYGAEEKYMCHETGLGSGRVWDVEYLYPTESDADAQKHILQAQADAVEEEVRREHGL